MKFKILLFALLLPLLIFSSCKKYQPEIEENELVMLNGNINLTISHKEISNALPKTLLYNLGDDAKFYFNKSQWRYTNDGLIVRIPINTNNTKYLYAIKKINSPDSIQVMLGEYIHAAGQHNGFTGKHMWVDLKGGKLYGVEYINDSAVSHLEPIQVFESDFESCALEHGQFIINSQGKIDLKPISSNTTFAKGAMPCTDPHKTSRWKGLSDWWNRIWDGVSDAWRDLLDFFGNGNWKSGEPLYELNPGFDGNGSAGGGSGYEGAGWTGSPGGMGGGGATPPVDEPPIEDEDGFPLEVPGIPGGGIFTPIEMADSNGFLGSRKVALNAHVNSDPYGMLDCNDIAAFESVLPWFREVASYQVPLVVLERMDSIRDAVPFYIPANTFMQDINDGIGVVNLDMFGVSISEMPNNPDDTTVKMTPLELLEYFRKNLSPYFTTGASSSFYPYVDNFMGSELVNENSKFGNHTTGALGAWVHINIPAFVLPVTGDTMGDDGTVIMSDYHIDDVDSAYWFTFTTAATRKDGIHPVSGNRRFVMRKSSSGNWQFQISGADRVWNTVLGYVNDLSKGRLIFDGADELWMVVRMNIENFININGGAAVPTSPENIKVRVKWEGAVKEFLKGNISLSELKDALNCP